MHYAQKKLKIFFSFLYVKVKEFPFMKLEHYIMQTKQDNVFCLSADYRLGLWLIFLRGFIFLMLYEVNDTLYNLLESCLISFPLFCIFSFFCKNSQKNLIYTVTDVSLISMLHLHELSSNVKTSLESCYKGEIKAGTFNQIHPESLQIS